MSLLEAPGEPRMVRFRVEYDIALESLAFMFDSHDFAQRYAAAVPTAKVSEVDPRIIWLKLPKSACRLQGRGGDVLLAVVFVSAPAARAWGDEIKVACVAGCDVVFLDEYEQGMFESLLFGRMPA